MLGVKLDHETFTSSLTRLCVWLTRTVLALARGCWLAQFHRCAPWTVTPELPRSAAAPGAAAAAADRDAAGSSVSPAASETSPAMAASLRTRGGRRTGGRLMAAPDFRCRAAAMTGRVRSSSLRRLTCQAAPLPPGELPRRRATDPPG